MHAQELERQILLQRGKMSFCSYYETSWMKMSFFRIYDIKCILMVGNKLFERRAAGPVPMML